jgi:PhnB protein
MPVSPVPPGYHTVTPYLIVDGATRALAWYTQAFNAREFMRISSPGDRIGHAEIEIGDSRIMLADESPAHDAKSPGAFGGSPVSLHLYVSDVDAIIAQAVAAGATIKAQPENKFYGDRMGTLMDPFGHTWYIATHIEDVAAEEIERRVAAMFNPGRPT